MAQSQEAEPLTIGKLAAAGGVGVETIRFYQRRRLLETPTRETGIRRYGPEGRAAPAVHQAGADGGLHAGGDQGTAGAGRGRGPKSRGSWRRGDRVLNARIAELQQARKSLRRLASECAEGTAGPCPILASFDI